MIAACREHDPELWFSTDYAEQQQARDICVSCPMVQACAQAALERPDTVGVWASVPLSGYGSKRRSQMQRLHHIAKGGRPEIPPVTRMRLNATAARHLRDQGMRVAEIAERLQISLSTATRYLGMSTSTEGLSA